MNENAISPTFSVDLNGFKQAVAEFLKALDDSTMSEAQLENGWKAVSLAYLGMKEQHPYCLPIAVSYFNYASKAYFNAMCKRGFL